jgi:hypothetical protein
MVTESGSSRPSEGERVNYLLMSGFNSSARGPQLIMSEGGNNAA